MTDQKTICTVGTGYVGMACAIGFAELGHRVTGYDIIRSRVRALQVGITPYREAGIEGPLLKHLQSGRITFHEELEPAVRDADFVIIAVGTPSGDDGSADLSAVEASIASIAPLVREDAIVILRSTVPPGTTDRLADRYKLKFAYAPEFLREGSAVADFLHPDRIVVGARSESTGAAYANLLASVGAPVIVTSFRNAELIKGFSNAFLALKISFANEVANVCDAVDADSLDVLRGIGHDRRIGTSFLAPGIGFGGPCFEKDVKSMHHLAGSLDTSRELLAATLRVNSAQPKRIVDMLESELGDDLRGVHVGIWGLAFKAGTDDVRDSLANRIIDDLLARGASLAAYDPAVKELPEGTDCAIAPTALAALEGADALLILTEWPEFATISPWTIAARLRRNVVVDGRNILDPSVSAAAGLTYRGVGRRASSSVSLAEAS